MTKSGIILKYESQLLKEYGLLRACMLKQGEIKLTLDNSKEDPAIRATYGMMYKLNTDDITAHKASCDFIELVLGDLRTINDLS